MGSNPTPLLHNMNDVHPYEKKLVSELRVVKRGTFQPSGQDADSKVYRVSGSYRGPQQKANNQIN
jgi:hypothetical protein